MFLQNFGKTKNKCHFIDDRQPLHSNSSSNLPLVFLHLDRNVVHVFCFLISSHVAMLHWKSVNLIGSLMVFYSVTLTPETKITQALLLKLDIILKFRLKNTQNCSFCASCYPLECLLKQLDYLPLFSLSYPSLTNRLFAHRKRGLVV